MAFTVQAASESHESLVTALEAKFPPTKTGSNAAVFTIQKDGVMAYPPATLMMPENKIVEGRVEHSRMLGSMNMAASVLAAGTRVYVTKIESKNEFVKLHVSTMDKFDTAVVGVAAVKRLNAVLAFKFGKDFLNTATVEQVSSQIAAVLGPDTGPAPGGATSNAAPPSAPAAPPPPQAPAAPSNSFEPVAPPPPPADAAPAAPAPKPVSISLGQSVDQVLAIMGQPQKINDLPGKKKQYVYPDLKITFTNGKVSDVQ
ncbi:MAG: hypothetical protein JO022_17770 [Acidobacteriaceae bacterium]|nr:hypothetical protein [Acidobacteriaceae bacterium]